MSDWGQAYPPEDVGSVPGYYDFCEAVKNSKHKEHRNMKQWFAAPSIMIIKNIIVKILAWKK